MAPNVTADVTIEAGGGKASDEEIKALPDLADRFREGADLPDDEGGEPEVDQGDGLPEEPGDFEANDTVEIEDGGQPAAQAAPKVDPESIFAAIAGAQSEPAQATAPEPVAPVQTPAPGGDGLSRRLDSIEAAMGQMMASLVPQQSAAPQAASVAHRVDGGAESLLPPNMDDIEAESPLLAQVLRSVDKLNSGLHSVRTQVDEKYGEIGQKVSGYERQQQQSKFYQSYVDHASRAGLADDPELVNQMWHIVNAAKSGVVLDEHEPSFAPARKEPQRVLNQMTHVIQLARKGLVHPTKITKDVLHKENPELVKEIIGDVLAAAGISVKESAEGEPGGLPRNIPGAKLDTGTKKRNKRTAPLGPEKFKALMRKRLPGG